ncbi:hypothetical protein SLS60_011737 [Paraconiothyrium brasiliense]|uniref:Heterokaryon incompatibility domain-containing protein n=1 Tax=Paraconiothyrium brasiliense TaxID=300254 RepID=A0ABR3QIG2_9PLEO
MASIFRCADIVLCAASASNSTEGCSIDEALEPASSFPFPSALSYQSNTSSQVHDVPRTQLFIRRDDGARSSLETCPIQKRGWIFQEILLAQRVLYFVNGQMIWQCHGLLQSEDGHISKTQTPGILRIDNDRILSSAPLYDLKKQFRIGMDKHVWWHILKDFFKRVFTKPEDTLPSLAGLIDVWKEHTGDDPVLGLWRKDLPFHMCWFFGPAFSIGDRVRGQPSWCWTTVPQSNRAILRHASCNIARSAEIIWQAAIRAIDIQWEGRPFVSRLKHARLSIYRVRATKGAFNQAISYLWDDKEEYGSRKAEAVEVLPLIITKSVDEDQTEGDRFHMHALLLEPSHMANGHAGYRRKGYADFISSSDYVDTDIDQQADEIIGGIEVIDVITVV